MRKLYSKIDIAQFFIKIFVCFIVLLIFLNCTTYTKHVEPGYSEYVEIDGKLYHFPLRIGDLEIIDVDTSFSISGWTKSIPPQPIGKKIKSISLKIKFTIFVDSKDTDWDKPIHLVANYSDGTKTNISFNSRSETLFSNHHNSFLYSITLEKSERIIFRLGFRNPITGKRVFVNSNDPYRTFDDFFSF